MLKEGAKQGFFVGTKVERNVGPQAKSVVGKILSIKTKLPDAYNYNTCSLEPYICEFPTLFVEVGQKPTYWTNTFSPAEIRLVKDIENEDQTSEQ